MSIDPCFKHHLLTLPNDVLGLVAVHAPKEIFLIASSTNKKYVKEIAFRRAYQLRHIWISQWEREQPIEKLIERDLFYKNRSFPRALNADKSELTPRFNSSLLSLYSYYELHSKKPQSVLREFENAERKKLSEIFKQLDPPKNDQEAKLFEERVRKLDAEMLQLHKEIIDIQKIIDQQTDIPFLLKIVFTIYDFCMSFFKSSNPPFLVPIDRPGYSFLRGNVRFDQIFPGPIYIDP